MKQDMRRVGNHPIALRQERVRITEHLLKALGPLWFSLKKIRHPPGTHLANEEYAVADPQPPAKPRRMGLAEIPCTEEQADGKGHALHKGHSHKTRQRILAAYRGNIVQTPEWNPVVNPQKDNLKRLQSEQDLF